MRHDRVRTAAVGMLACFLFGTVPVGKAQASGVIENVAAALCGRDVAISRLRDRAAALDSLQPGPLPPSWKKATAENLEVWLAAPLCAEANPEEIALVSKRRESLRRLQAQVEHARITEAIAADIAGLPRRQRGPEWPGSFDCPACLALRAAESTVATLQASRWPSAGRGDQTPLGERFGAAAQRERLIDRLCAALPPRGARAEIERQFRYYSWTAQGARLLQVADLFEQPHIAAGCSRQ
jgi:hypothetical protein